MLKYLRYSGAALALGLALAVVVGSPANVRADGGEVCIAQACNTLEGCNREGEGGEEGTCNKCDGAAFPVPGICKAIAD